MSHSYISKAVRAKVSARSRFQCGYCLSQEAIVGTPMELGHAKTDRVPVSFLD